MITVPLSIKGLKKNHKVLKMIKCDATCANLGAVIVSLVLLCPQFFTCCVLYCVALLFSLDPFKGRIFWHCFLLEGIFMVFEENTLKRLI